MSLGLQGRGSRKNESVWLRTPARAPDARTRERWQSVGGGVELRAGAWICGPRGEGPGFGACAEATPDGKGALQQDKMAGRSMSGQLATAARLEHFVAG